MKEVASVIPYVYAFGDEMGGDDSWLMLLAFGGVAALAMEFGMDGWMDRIPPLLFPLKKSPLELLVYPPPLLFTVQLSFSRGAWFWFSGRVWIKRALFMTGWLVLFLAGKGGGLGWIRDRLPDALPALYHCNRPDCLW